MVTSEILASIDKALGLLPRQMTSDKARLMLLAIGLQESLFSHRRQLVKVGGKLVPQGPAKGFWQFERLGGCRGIVDHPSSRYWAASVCAARGVAFNATAIWNAIETDDVLAAACARLLLFTDPKVLPEVEDVRGAWNLYLRTWRPGAYDRGTPAERADLRVKWEANHAQARNLLYIEAES